MPAAAAMRNAHGCERNSPLPALRGGGAGWFGSLAVQRVKKPSIVGMASTFDGRGYWLVSSSGRVYTFGDAARLAIRGSAIRGIAAQG